MTRKFCVFLLSRYIYICNTLLQSNILHYYSIKIWSYLVILWYHHIVIIYGYIWYISGYHTVSQWYRTCICTSKGLTGMICPSPAFRLSRLPLRRTNWFSADSLKPRQNPNDKCGFWHKHMEIRKNQRVEISRQVLIFYQYRTENDHRKLKCNDKHLHISLISPSIRGNLMVFNSDHLGIWPVLPAYVCFSLLSFSLRIPKMFSTAKPYSFAFAQWTFRIGLG